MHVAWQSTVVEEELAGHPSDTTLAHVDADAASTHVLGGGGGGGLGGGGLRSTHTSKEGNAAWQVAGQYSVVAASPTGQPALTTTAHADAEAVSAQ